jgi:asparagine N-glycosylation enzyme membrane subunit Stt3
MTAGLFVATLQFLLDQSKAGFEEGTWLYDIAQIPAIYMFPFIFIVSLLGSFLGTLLTPATSMETLKEFYKNVRPWGFWGPVYKALHKDDQTATKNNDFVSDMLNCVVGVVWQSSMILLPIYFLIRDYQKTGLVLIVFIVTSVILKFTWLDKVKKYKD